MKSIERSDFHEILNAAFPSADIPEVFSDLKSGDIPEWDSLGNFNLLLAVEEYYEVRFTMDQMAELKSVEQIYNALIEMNV